ncbi:MAG: aminoglycoside phosphotransferase family protein [Mycobacteriales bacterium]
MVLHENEIEINLPLVRALVDQALPEFAGRRLRPMAATGSSNALFRLGDDLIVRMPRQPGGSATITKEARWLPYVAPALPIAVPEIVAVGGPDLGYPERWSIVRWIDGHSPDVSIPLEAPDPGLARDLAEVVAALRAVHIPTEAQEDPALRSYRGGSLASVDTYTRDNIASCRRLAGLGIDLEACLRIWSDAQALCGTEAVEPRWLHGDLLAENLLLRDGHLAAVLDFGALSVGDPTVDLIVAWALLDPPGRALFRSVLGVDEVTWRRGRAWALAIAMMTFPYYWATMPQRCAAAMVMAHAVLADATPEPAGAGKALPRKRITR